MSLPPSSAALAKNHLWRSDITGIRAIAVLPVLIFHAFPSIFPGGFLGVDIFFVISGYLISGIIFRGLINQNFSYTDFYVKRIRRIFPNLILVLAFVLLVGYFILFAYEYDTLGKHVIASSFFAQNFRLLKEAGDYFATSEIGKPLLHLWSLAIEEQFYILFPLVCSFIWSISKRSSFIIGFTVLCIATGSFAACLMSSNSTFAFYFPLTRFWEIGVGMILAYLESFKKFDTRLLSLETRQVLSVAGFTAILGSMLFYSPGIQVPGWYSLLPVLGTALVISAHEDAVINRTVLTWKPMIFVGLISYSLYLWHWPLLSFLHLSLESVQAWQNGLALVASFVIASLVYRYVENPFRIYKGLSQKRLISLLMGILILCAGCGFAIDKTNGFKWRNFNQKFQEMNAFVDWVSYSKRLHHRQINGVDLWVSDSKQNPEILILGDSHAEQYLERVYDQSRQTGKVVAFMTVPGCYSIMGVGNNKDGICKKQPEIINTVLSHESVKTVLFSYIWGRYLNDHPNEFGKGLLNIVAFANQRPDQRFVVLLDPPWDTNTYDIRKRGGSGFNRLLSNRLPYEQFIVDYPANNDWLMGNQKVQEILNSKVETIQIDHLVCPERKCNLLLSYKDADHLRASYVKKHASWIDTIFK